MAMRADRRRRREKLPKNQFFRSKRVGQWYMQKFRLLLFGVEHSGYSFTVKPYQRIGIPMRATAQFSVQNLKFTLLFRIQSLKNMIHNTFS